MIKLDGLNAFSRAEKFVKNHQHYVGKNLKDLIKMFKKA